MMLVMVGTHPQSFDRLLEAVDNLIADGTIKENVIMQTGYSNYIPKHAKWFKFIEYGKMIELIKKSSVVITHGGIGSVLLSIRYNKPTIVVPRLRKLNEHTNDHQLEIVKELSSQGKVIPVYDISQLKSALKKSKSFKLKYAENESKILQTIDKFLTSIGE